MTNEEMHAMDIAYEAISDMVSDGTISHKTCNAVIFAIALEDDYGLEVKKIFASSAIYAGIIFA